jgi:DNA-directed RNA polymerase specialized sigma24 family protein
LKYQSSGRRRQAEESRIGGGARPSRLSAPTRQKLVDKLEEPVNGSKIPQSVNSAMDLKKLSNRKLVERFLGSADSENPRNSDAWKEFERRMRPVIAATVLRTLSSQDRQGTGLHEEFIHDTFVQLLDDDCRRLKNMRWLHERAIFGFMQAIASHTVIDYYRRKRPTFIDLDDPSILGQLFHESNFGDNAVINDLRVRIDKYLLSRTSKSNYQRDRNMFWLFYRWGYTDKQIARLPGINLPMKKIENTRRQLLFEVKRELKCENK